MIWLTHDLYMYMTLPKDFTSAKHQHFNARFDKRSKTITNQKEEEEISIPSIS